MNTVEKNFSGDELQAFCQRNDLLAWLMVLVNWLLIVAAFALVAWQTNPLTVILALILLGNRQLGCGVIMHECGHGSLFKSRTLNKFVGEWFGAAPTVYRLEDYMQSHLRHHQEAGTLNDPDLHRYRNYPVDKATLRRRFWRDATGQTSWKNVRATLRKNEVLITDGKGNTQFSMRNLLTRLYAPIITNLIIFLLLAIAGYPFLYLLWVAAYFSTYTVVSRIRNLAEHAAVPDLTDVDPIRNTRTTIPYWWERFTCAPNSVNYHLEHHLMPAVPKYRLAKFHQALSEKGLLDEADICQGYGEVMRKLVAA